MTFSAKPLLFIDIETYSSEDLTKSGVHKYVEADDFEVMLLAYAYGEEPVAVLDLVSKPNDPRIASVLNSIKDSSVIKVAHNCSFERTALSKHLGTYLPPEQWEDTMLLAAMNGLPQSLEAVGDALGLCDKKLKTGTSLINHFCKPRKPTLTNPNTRNLPENSPEKWELFKEYNARDVEVERAIYNTLKGYKVLPFEREVFALDARINDRGVLVDLDLAKAAIEVDDAFTEEHTQEMQRLTGIDNPNSVVQLKEWLGNVGLDTDSLTKGAVKDLKKQATDLTTKRVLELRQMLGKTSTSKYKAMLVSSCQDGRIRGILQYYGAARTGRWAGRRVQLQNLPQNHLTHIDQVREVLRSRDLKTLEMLFDSVPDTLSQLIRTAFIAPSGYTFLVADYSAIEARVIAYLAGEQWRLEVFAGDGKIYEASYSKAFNVPIESVKKGSPERQKGKIMELALGYGGGVQALVAFGADELGLTTKELQGLVTAWRVASPTIPDLWRRVEDAASNAIARPGQAFKVMRTESDAVCTFYRDAQALRCELPSGRVLSYWAPRLENGTIAFMGQNQVSKKWALTKTWGGRLVENIVQAFARDCLAVAMLRLDKHGYRLAFHVHDEVIIEAKEGSKWEDVADIMSEPIPWAPDLLLKADGYATNFYKKD